MNILFFLLPKSQIAYVLDDFTLRQTVEKLHYHHYTAIPVLDREGKYLRTVSEGDILSYLTEHDGMDFKKAEDVIQKSLETVQQIASLLGENAAETEIMLNSLIDAFSVHNEKEADTDGFTLDEDNIE